MKASDQLDEDYHSTENLIMPCHQQHISSKKKPYFSRNQAKGVCNLIETHVDDLKDKQKHEWASWVLFSKWF